MPYGIRESDGQQEVYNKQTGKVYGTHPNKKKALAQMRAILANTHETFKSMLNEATNDLHKAVEEKMKTYTADEIDKFHRALDKLVHSHFGHSTDEQKGE